MGQNNDKTHIHTHVHSTKCNKEFYLSEKFLGKFMSSIFYEWDNFFFV
jgi:hypothetical protein